MVKKEQFSIFLAPRRTTFLVLISPKCNTFSVHHLVSFPSARLSIYHLLQVNQGRPCTITHRIYLRLCDSNLNLFLPKLCQVTIIFRNGKTVCPPRTLLEDFLFHRPPQLVFGVVTFFVDYDTTSLSLSPSIAWRENQRKRQTRVTIHGRFQLILYPGILVVCSTSRKTPIRGQVWYSCFLSHVTVLVTPVRRGNECRLKRKRLA